ELASLRWVRLLSDRQTSQLSGSLLCLFLQGVLLFLELREYAKYLVDHVLQVLKLRSTKLESYRLVVVSIRIVYFEQDDRLRLVQNVSARYRQVGSPSELGH